jgi:hypothetical protein
VLDLIRTNPEPLMRPDEEKELVQDENSSEGLSSFLAEMAEHNEKIAEEAQTLPHESESLETKPCRLKKKKEEEGEGLAEAG